MQVRGEQLAEEHAELVALRHELNQRDRELSRRATEQATEAANTQVQHHNAPPTPSPTQPTRGGCFAPPVFCKTVNHCDARL